MAALRERLCSEGNMLWRVERNAQALGSVDWADHRLVRRQVGGDPLPTRGSLAGRAMLSRINRLPCL